MPRASWRRRSRCGPGRDAFGIAVDVARISNLYGTDNPETVIGRALAQAALGHDLVVRHVDPIRDFLHADDAVEGLLRLAQTGAQAGFRVVNLSTGRRHVHPGGPGGARPGGTGRGRAGAESARGAERQRRSGGRARSFRTPSSGSGRNGRRAWTSRPDSGGPGRRRGAPPPHGRSEWAAAASPSSPATAPNTACSTRSSRPSPRTPGLEYHLLVSGAHLEGRLRPDDGRDPQRRLPHPCRSAHRHGREDDLGGTAHAPSAPGSSAWQPILAELRPTSWWSTPTASRASPRS